MYTVYIETSVISYYTSQTSRDIVIAGHQVSTKEFWNKLISSDLKPVISALVIKEASQMFHRQKNAERLLTVFMYLTFRIRPKTYPKFL